jgi:putative Holliday junction resolvase
MAAQGPVLALDYGERRIGVAVSDPEGEFAFPAPALVREGSLERDLCALARLVEERGVHRIVVGLPIHLDGRVGPEARAARAFARRLAAATGLEVEMLDERWTTREAERALREAGAAGGGARRRRERRSGAVDSAAAALLLRTWLARRRAAGAAGDAGAEGAAAAGPGEAD